MSQIALTNPTAMYVSAGDVTECASCGVLFWMTAQYYTQRREDHNKFYCPNGHGLSFKGQTEAERLAAELKQERERRAVAVSERDQAEASRRAWKGQVTRLRNRAIEGDCPLCGQHLRDLARHIGRVHPGEQAELTEAEATA